MYSEKGHHNFHDEFEEWQIEHTTSCECDITFHSSLHAVETEGTNVLWTCQ